MPAVDPPQKQAIRTDPRGFANGPADFVDSNGRRVFISQTVQALALLWWLATTTNSNAGRQRALDPLFIVRGANARAFQGAWGANPEKIGKMKAGQDTSGIVFFF